MTRPETTASSRPGLHPGDDLLAQCIQCGMCLPACPTYSMTPFERANPRGRIRLMRAVADGEMEAGDPAFGDAMGYCVGCRACETACPAGVQFGRLLETAREAAEEAGSLHRPSLPVLDWLLDEIVGSPARLRWAVRLLRLYRRTIGRLETVRRTIEARWPSLAALEAAAPRAVPPPSRRWRLPAVVEPGDADREGPAPSPRGTVALHPGCLQSVLLPGVNGDTAQVLAYNAWRVVVPEGFRCCGALHAHAGRLRWAERLARRNVDPLEEFRGPILVNAAGCGLRLTNLGKPFWPDRGHTKGDLLQYYADVAPVLLPHIEGRAMVMKRYPSGWKGKHFFMKRTPDHAPDWLATCAIEHGSGSVIDFPVVRSLPDILWLITLGCIGLNPGSARCDDVDRPDVLHFDLYPVEHAGFERV
ncbi:MAG: 4Fe-4S dicluster domain-containing protein, partial [Gemmatimonadetes bacterium]|nr:4Fe-4S dicluster domain-containing protein [Gemmatimonadota bacterium]